MTKWLRQMIPMAVGLVLLVAGREARAQDTRKSAADAAYADYLASKAPEHMKIGALAGVGFPNPLSIEAIVKMERTVAVGVEYGGLPALSVSGVQVSSWAAAGDLRWFPLHGSFFVGMRAGLQHVDANTSINTPPFGSVNEVLQVETWFVNPRIGFLWNAGALALGIDAGVQIPLSMNDSSTLSLAHAPAAQSAVNLVGGSVLPTVDLLRLGLML